MKKVVVYGAGAYGKIFYYDVERTGCIDICAFTVDERYIMENQLFGLPIVPFEYVETIYPPSEYDMIVLCGYNIMRNRKSMYDKAIAKGYHLINYISPKAYIEDIPEMGNNNIILSESIIGYSGKMGNNNVIRQKVYLGHEFLLGNHNIISVGCMLGGKCTFGDLIFLGINVSSKGYVKYGSESLIGVGSVVVTNIPSYAKVYGNPAKIHGYFEHDKGVILLE